MWLYNFFCGDAVSSYETSGEMKSTTCWFGFVVFIPSLAEDSLWDFSQSTRFRFKIFWGAMAAAWYDLDELDESTLGGGTGLFGGSVSLGENAADISTLE